LNCGAIVRNGNGQSLLLQVQIVLMLIFQGAQIQQVLVLAELIFGVHLQAL